MTRTSRIVALIMSAIPATASAGDDSTKPVVLKDDELAVLADLKSPDRKAVIEKYTGKVLKIYGHVGVGDFIIIPPAAGAKSNDKVLLKLDGIVWTQDPAVLKRDLAAQRSHSKISQNMTIYGRLDTDGKGIVLLYVSTDPKYGGVRYTRPEKEPARLKK